MIIDQRVVDEWMKHQFECPSEDDVREFVRRKVEEELDEWFEDCSIREWWKEMQDWRIP